LVLEIWNFTDMASDARRTALAILTQLGQEQTTLDAVLGKFSEDQRRLAKRDRALLNILVYGVQRWRARLDYILSCFSRTPVERLDPVVLNILRLGLYQIIFLDRVPKSAAVNTSVEITKTAGPPWVAGFVNAVLRKAAEKHETVVYPDPKTDLEAALAVEKSFPSWLLRRWLKRWGQTAVELLCDVINVPPPITLRTNTLKTSQQELAKALTPLVGRIYPTTFTPDGLCIFNPGLPIAELGPFKKGWFTVQDEGAQLVSLVLDPQPDEHILDACAGLGGKTGHIAQLMRNRGSIVAVDTDGRKLANLEADMLRLGISTVSTRQHDLNTPLPLHHRARFDRILLDAPCSGLGVLRRNPDTKWSASERDVARHHRRQVDLLGRLAPLVKPGGIVVFAVCSCEPEENQEVVQVFLQNHPDFAIEQHSPGLPPQAATVVSPEGYVRTYPHHRDMDGFFCARLRRRS
jgi:16S rRNA (cytosine967-C5)-methyltransferase